MSGNGVNAVNGGQGGYNTIILVNPKTGKKVTYNIPVGKTFNCENLMHNQSGTQGEAKVKQSGREFTLTGDFDNKDSEFWLAKMALEAMDTNKDGIIDNSDNNQGMRNLDATLKGVESNYNVGIDYHEGSVLFTRYDETGMPNDRFRIFFSPEDK